MRTLGIVLGALIVPLASPADEGKADRPNLDGTYKIVSGEKDGKAEPRSRIEGAVVVIAGNKITGMDRDKKEFFSCNFKIETSTKPWSIRMISTEPKKGELGRGIIEKDGDTVKICYAISGGDTPTTFKTKEKQHCFELKRTSK